MLRWFASVLVVLLLLLYNLPFLIRDQAVIWLRQHGAEDARLTALKINWLQGRLVLQGLSARAEGRPLLRLQELQVGLDYKSLWQQRILLQQVSVTGLQLGIRQQQDELWLGPVDLRQLSSAEPDAEPAASDSNWSFGLRQLQLKDIDWQAELAGQKHHLQLKQGQLKDFLLWAPEQPLSVILDGRVNGAPLKLSSEAVPLPEKKTSRLTIQLQDFPLQSITAPFLPALRARVDLDLQLEASGNLSQGDSDLRQSGRVSVKNLSWQQDDLRLQQQQIDWNGDVTIDWRKGTLASINSNNRVQLKGLQLQQGETELELDAASLQTVIQGQAPAEWQAKISELMLQGVNLQQADLQLALQQAQAQGNVDLEAGQLKQIRLDQLNLQQLAVAQGLENPLQLQLQNLETRGQLGLNQEQQWQVGLPSLQLQAVRLQADAGQLATLDSLMAEQLAVENTTEQIKLHSLQLAGLTLLGEQQPVSQWQQIRLQNLQLQNLATLDIEHLMLRGGNSRLVLSESRTLPDLEWWQQQFKQTRAEAASTDTQSPAETGAKTAFRTRIGRLSVEGNSQIELIDWGVKPAFKNRVVIQSASLQPLDTGSDRASRFQLKSRLGQFTQMDADGQMELFSGNYGGSWKLNLKGLELPLVSPYFSHFTGYLLRSGQLSLTSEGNIKSRQLNGDTDIRLNRLDVARDKSERSEEFNQKVTMPLETAIMVLQDKDQNIQLDLPLNGSLDDPQFGYQAIINKLAGKGLKNAALGYLTKALQPFGALITVAEFAIDAAEKGSLIRLQPVGFEPLSSELNGESNTYLEKLGGMLQERPAMRLNICGQAVAADSEPLRQQLLQEQPDMKPEALKKLLQERLQQLAVARGDVIKQQLSEQYKISVERLFTCYPEVDSNSDQPPRTLLGL